MEHIVSPVPARTAGIALIVALALAGCENLPEQLKPKASASDPLAGGTSLSFEERDIEAPDVFNITDTAVWDGRPSFGGVWAAYPSDTQPERVVITNNSNGKSVVGALFRVEKDNPGPKVKLSSDAATQLGVVPGEPTEVSIVAIRRQPVQVMPETPVEPVAAPQEVTETVLEPVETPEAPAIGAEVAAAIEAAPKPRPQSAAPQAAPTPEPVKATPAPATGDMPSKPFIQVATLSSEANASTLEKKLSDAGISSLIRVSKTSKGKDLYRVLAGPATSADGLRTLSKQVADLGFSDAFPVTN